MGLTSRAEDGPVMVSLWRPCRSCRRYRLPKTSFYLIASLSFLLFFIVKTTVAADLAEHRTPNTTSTHNNNNNNHHHHSSDSSSTPTPTTQSSAAADGLMTSTKVNRRGKLAFKLAHKWMSRKPGGSRLLAPYGRCGPPPAIPHAKWNYFMSGIPLRARVQYQCHSGYLLEGDDTIMCSDDGRWSDVPACLGSGGSSEAKIEPKSAASSNTGLVNLGGAEGCGPMPRVENGFIKETTLVGPFSRVGDYILFDCASGFVIDGEDRIECLTGRRWSSAPPRCSSGPSQRTPLPTCGKAHLLLANAYAAWASYSVHQDAFPGDRVQYTCTPGFQMLGNNTIVCLPSGEWSNMPLCHALNTNCSVPTAPQDGFLVGVQNGTATFACHSGFELVGAATIVCQPDNTWTTSPRCRDNADASPNELLDALVMPPSDMMPPATAGEQDHAGIVDPMLILFEERVSNSNVTCPQPPRVANARQITSYLQEEIPRQDDFVTYQCFYRYYLDGPATLVCNERGRWSPEPPICRAVTAPTTAPTTTTEPGCVSPPTLPNTVIVKYFDGIARAGDVFEYHCADGYEPTASSGRAVCTPNRRWAVDPNFACRIVQNPPSDFTTEDPGFQQPMTTPSPSQQQPYCPAAVEIDNGRMAVFYLGRARPGDVVEYKCLEGFVIEGQARIRCREDYTWSARPRCVAQEQTASGCSQAPTIDNGYIASSASSNGDSTFQAGDFVTFACYSGYQLIGNRNAYCLTSGRWTTKPRCAPDQNSINLVPLAATTTTTRRPTTTTLPPTTTTTTTRRTTTTTRPPPTTTYDWSWTLTTEEETTTRRRPTTTTEPFVWWTTEERTTRRTTQPPVPTTRSTSTTTQTTTPVCSDLASPPYAIRELTSYWMAARPGDFVRFRCLPGYTLVGNNRVVCQNDGSWSLSPSCVLSTSSSVLSGQNVRPLPTTTRTTTTVETTPAVIDYNAGAFTDDVFSFTTTPEPTRPPPRQTQAPTRVCTAAPLVANAAQRPSYRVGQSPQPGEYVDYMCRPGFVLVGLSRVTCQSNLRWSAVPTCEPVQTCNEPPRVANGFVAPNTQEESGIYKPGDSVVVTCMAGFDLRGGSTVYCLASGNWSQAPECQQAGPTPACTKLPAVENAVQVAATFQVSANIGDFVRYRCQTGYLMVGNDTVTCLSSGAWTNLPKCVRACPEPARIENGRIKGASYSGRPPLPGDSVLVECNANFTLTGGVNYMLCRSDNTWTQAPTCVGSARGQLCGIPSPVPNADVVQKSFNDGNQPRKGDFIVYQCRAGFTTEDSVTIVCGDMGSWSRAPNCLRETTCPILSDIPNGQLIDKTWRAKPRKGDTATFRCLDGAELRGNPLVVCKVDGTWSALPTCEKVVLCDMPPNVDRATITYRTFNAQPRRGDAVTFDCMAGFEVIGFRTAYCKDDGTWSALPVCQKIGCGPVLPAPLNAIIANRSFTETESKFGDYVMYACNPGFRALTSTITTCQSNGLWTQLPDCQPISCGVLPPLPANSRVVFKSFENNARINEFFDLACDSGFVLEGRAVVQCMANGEWTEMPRCRTVKCPVPEPIPFATSTVIKAESGVETLVTDQQFNIGDRVRYDCNEGYELKGLAVISCLQTGEWSEVPYCEEMTCPPPPVIDNSIMKTSVASSTVFKEGFEIDFSCQPGFTFETNVSKIVCKRKSWEPLPKCIQVDCGRPPAAENAQVRFTSSNPGGLATYSCRPGYTISDRKLSQLACNQNGSWVPSQPPQCTLITCQDDPAKVEFAMMNITGRNIGNVVTYACQTGFKLIGPDQAVCGPNGKWSDAPICLSVSCQPPPTITNGYYNGSGLYIGDKVYWNCYEGFTLVGNPISTCKGDMTWDQIPECKYIVCPDLGAIGDGIVRYNSKPLVPNVKAAFQCMPNFELTDGDVQITCLMNGTWSGRQGRCEPVPLCPMPNIGNGYALPSQSEGFPLNAVVQFFCEAGYQLNGSALASCTEEGTWTQIPSCVACQPIYGVENGQIVGNGIQPLVGTSIDIICNPGYRPDKPHTTLTCTSAGHWSNVVPKCVAITCEKLTVEFGALSSLVTLPSQMAEEKSGVFAKRSLEEELDIYLPGTNVRLVCQIGYRSSGPNSTVCLNNGHWSNPLGNCIRSTCLLPAVPANGRMVRLADMTRPLLEPVKGEVIRFSCDEGHKLVGTSELRCLESGHWSDQVPQCVEMRCLNPPKVENGFVAANGAFRVGSSVLVTCDTGYKIKGRSMVSCLADGQWDQFPVCEQVECSTPPPIENGRVIYDRSDVGGRAQYRCNRGFNLTGPAFITCQPTGDWAPELRPRCVEIVCNQPPLIPNGVIAMHQDPPKAGAVATYICLDGYQIEGPQMIICTENGIWTSTLPTCKPVQCGLPPIVPNASADLPSERDVGVRIVYSCVSGTTGFGDPTSVCLANGNWSLPNFACKPSTCPEPPMVSNGDILRLSGQSPGDYAEYRCRLGYQMSGSNIVTCLRDGSWSDQPTCVGVSSGGCNPPPDLPNAEVTYSSTDVGALATYTCRTGYRAIGNPVVSCTSAGEWTEAPSCREVVCFGPPSVSNAEILRLTGYSFGSTATYRCKQRFQMLGDPTIVCGQNGAWSSIPSCVAADCVEPPQITNGVVEVQGFIVGSQAIYRCFPGYSISGPEDAITCQSSGRWSLPVPECNPDLPDAKKL